MRKIWNFAMAAIVIVASAGLLAACDKDDVGTDNPWSNGEYEFAETNLSAMEVLSSTDLWIAVDIYYYTEPDGKGDKFYYGNPGSYDGGGFPLYSFTPKFLTTYNDNLAIPVRYYIDYALEEVDENMYLYNDGKEYIKILDYDEKSVLIETNAFLTTRNDVTYKYSTILLEKKEMLDPNWRDNYISYEEYWENRDYWNKKAKGEHIASLPIEELERWIKEWLEKGNYTVEGLEELFMELCPEYYESTIKYILEKYK